MDDKQLSPGEIVVLVAGAVALVASFLPWIDVSGFTASSWDSDVLFPVSWLVPMSAVVAAVLLALQKFGNVAIPDVLGYTPHLMMKTFAIMGAVLAIAWVIAIEDAGIGFWLSVLATLGATAGVIMMERAQAPGSTGTRPI